MNAVYALWAAFKRLATSVHKLADQVDAMTKDFEDRRLVADGPVVEQLEQKSSAEQPALPANGNGRRKAVVAGNGSGS